MKKLLFYHSFFILLLITCYYPADAQTYVWTKKTDFGGGIRYVPSAFTIGNKGYVGCGSILNGGNYVTFNDFWEYDPSVDVWTQKADLPGIARHGASGFSILDKGYITIGWTQAGSPLNDLWEYDPNSNSWTQKSNFGGAGRYSGTAFVIDSFAYVGCGYSPYLKDFWKYDPSTDSWTQIADIGGVARTALSSFTVDTLGYVFAGLQQFSFYSKELWAYSPSTNTWTQKTDCPGDGRGVCTSFTLNGKGICGLGNNSLNEYQDFYSYDPVTDAWTQITDFGGGPRDGAISFTIDNVSYCGLGTSTIYPNLTLQSDWWSLQEVNDHSLIVGNTYFDDNNNQVLDSTEAPVKNVIVQILPGPVYVSSNHTGIYAAIADSGSFDISIPNPPLYYSYSPATINVVFPQTSMVDSGNNFAFLPVGIINDLRIMVTPMGIVRAFHPDYINLAFTNIGTTVMSGTIDLQLDTNISFLTTFPYDSNVVQNGNLITWAYANLQPGESRTIQAQCMIGNVFMNDTLVMTGTIYPVIGDTVPADNSDTQMQIVIGSYDPNDITVNHETLIVPQVVSGEWLEYIIRFQNTGNAEAIDIIVTDSLGGFVEPSGFEMMSASAPYYFKMEGSGMCTWTFKNIMLPDSTSNEPGSHGFIRYRIKPKNSLVVGDIIENFAAIYFDNNPPVITNIATTTIVSPAGINGLAAGSTGVNVFPNPNDGSFVVSFNSTLQGRAKMDIMNTEGQLVVQKIIQINSGLNQYRVSEKLQQGIYLIRVKAGDQTYLAKYLVN